MTAPEITDWESESRTIRSVKIGEIVYHVANPVPDDNTPIEVADNFAQVFNVEDAYKKQKEIERQQKQEALETMAEAKRLQSTLSMSDPLITGLPDRFLCPYSAGKLHKDIVVRIYDAFKGTKFTVTDVVKRFQTKGVKKPGIGAIRNHLRCMVLMNWVTASPTHPVTYFCDVPIENWIFPEQEMDKTETDEGK